MLNFNMYRDRLLFSISRFLRAKKATVENSEFSCQLHMKKKSLKIVKGRISTASGVFVCTEDDVAPPK